MAITKLQYIVCIHVIHCIAHTMYSVRLTYSSLCEKILAERGFDPRTVHTM